MHLSDVAFLSSLTETADGKNATYQEHNTITSRFVTVEEAQGLFPDRIRPIPSYADAGNYNRIGLTADDEVLVCPGILGYKTSQHSKDVETELHETQVSDTAMMKVCTDLCVRHPYIGHRSKVR